MLLDYHSQFCQRKRIGYAFKNALITVVNQSFADDITLVQEIVTWTKTMAFKPDYRLKGFLEINGEKPNSPSFKTAHIHSMIRFLQ